MNKLILLACLLALNAQGQLRTNVTLVWDYPVSETTNIWFFVRGTNAISSWSSNWPVIAVVAGAENFSTPTTVTFPLAPQKYFFVCQASNYWGLSDPSNVAAVPSPPRSDVLLRAR